LYVLIENIFGKKIKNEIKSEKWSWVKIHWLGEKIIKIDQK